MKQYVSSNYLLKASVEAALLRMAIQLASDSPNMEPLRQALNGLVKIKRDRDSLILGVLSPVNSILNQEEMLQEQPVAKD